MVRGWYHECGVELHRPASSERAEQVAIIWEGDDPKESKKITYRELHEHVRRFANVLWKSNTSLNTTRIWSRENGSR
jgi:acyl-coenzyme A synthetase/AMP-(fatty) acid ligase